jgi:hypothetical protein
MVLTGYFVWWYGAGLQQSAQIVMAALGGAADFFSLEALIKTWWSPWKNDVISERNLALSDQFKIWQQNLASRIVGFLVRTVVIATALLCIGLLSILSFLALGLWLTLPIVAVLLPLIGVRLMFQ